VSAKMGIYPSTLLLSFSFECCGRKWRALEDSNFRPSDS
jgi:hypothetical protein